MLCGALFGSRVNAVCVLQQELQGGRGRARRAASRVGRLHRSQRFFLRPNVSRGVTIRNKLLAGVRSFLVPYTTLAV